MTGWPRSDGKYQAIVNATLDFGYSGTSLYISSDISAIFKVAGFKDYQTQVKRPSALSPDKS